MGHGAAIPIAQRHFTPERVDLLIGLTMKTDDDQVGIWGIDEELVEETNAACQHLGSATDAFRLRCIDAIRDNSTRPAKDSDYTDRQRSDGRKLQKLLSHLAALFCPNSHSF